MRDKPISALAAFSFAAILCMNAAQAKTCGVTGAGVAFGAFDTTTSTNLDTIGYVEVDCNGSIDVELSLSVGNGTGANYAAGRRMTQGAGRHTLRYQLYANAGRTQVLGDGTGGSVTLNIRDIHNVRQAIWARVPGGQRSVAPGNYSDTVMATIRY